MASVLTLPARRYRDGECKLALVKAEGLKREKKYDEAGRNFVQAIAHLIGSELKIPIDATYGGGVSCPVYSNLTMDECLTVMTCANGASRCLYETGKLVEASFQVTSSVQPA